MTLDQAKNKYVKRIRYIKTIQEYLCNRAIIQTSKGLLLQLVPRFLAVGYLRRHEAEEHFYDPTTNTVSLVDEEFGNQCAADSLSSKGMFQLKNKC